MIVPPLSPRNSTSGDDWFESRQEILSFVGPILIGALCNWFLLGGLTLQLYVYYLCFPSDYWWIKFSAYGLCLLELGQTVLVTELAWVDLCAGWGIESTLLHIDWGFSMTPVANGLIACWVQIYFAWRVWALGRNMFWKSVAVVILALSVTHASVAVITGVKLSEVGYLISYSKLVIEIRNMFYLYLSAGAASNFVIAVSMLYFFISTKRKMGWSKDSDRRITKLIRSTFETGALCSAISIIDLAIYIRFGHNFARVATVMVLSKLYSNALMSSLNSRAARGFYEGPSMSDSREEGHTTTGRFHATQFTSVGIPVTTRTDGSEWVNRGDEPRTDWTQGYFKKGRIHAGTTLSNFGRA
ncbi:hypothetical protein V8E52_005598 [Russula decolorans]